MPVVPALLYLRDLTGCHHSVLLWEAAQCSSVECRHSALCSSQVAVRVLVVIHQREKQRNRVELAKGSHAVCVVVPMGGGLMCNLRLIICQRTTTLPPCLYTGM